MEIIAPCMPRSCVLWTSFIHCNRQGEIRDGLKQERDCSPATSRVLLQRVMGAPRSQRQMQPVDHLPYLSSIPGAAAGLLHGLGGGFCSSRTPSEHLCV